MPPMIGRVVSRPRSRSPVNRSVTTLVFSVLPSASPRGCWVPSIPIPSATTQVITEVHAVDHHPDQVQPGQVGGE
jgi:hypothetical protein